MTGTKSESQSRVRPCRSSKTMGHSVGFTISGEEVTEAPGGS